MKNKIILIFFLVLIWIATTFYFINRRVQTQLREVYSEKHSPLPCAKEGATIGSAMRAQISCCGELKEMIQLEYNGECASSPVPGAMITCSSKCGNATCESWEDICNCPQDCKKSPEVVLVPQDDRELRSCTSNNDCKFVEPKTCCGCYETINKKYTNYWSSSVKQDCNALDIACAMCQYYENDLHAVCIDKTCQGTPK